MKKQQQRIEMILDAKKIQYEKLDIAATEELKKEMRDRSGNPSALPPQLFNGETYCGVSFVLLYCVVIVTFHFVYGRGVQGMNDLPPVYVCSQDLMTFMVRACWKSCQEN